MFTFDRKTLKKILNENKNSAVVAAAGLALFGGLALGDVAPGPDTAPANAPAGTVAAQGHASRADRSPQGVPSTDTLMPNGVPAGQVSFAPTADQKANADEIIQVGEQMDLPPRAQVIAVATSLQETHLNNYGHLGDANDHDSLGLFQQRPSSGWGSPDQLTDPDYASRAFYSQLKDVPGYDSMPLTDAAQTVQVSAYPDAYAKWEQMAAGLVQQYHAEQAQK
ncbi:hypothetical protein [Rhizomonospora bruguierae]|uniref:hypothetical protein n=1 Tax=Rhizomonospora bruguierae TaxID=1581705 RepID=UPI0020C0B7BE|nr:hypothetical protein [Micromonospora sp. NBRC 107566]